MENRIKTIKTFKTVDEIVNYLNKVFYKKDEQEIRREIQEKALIKFGCILVLHDPYELLN